MNQNQYGYGLEGAAVIAPVKSGALSGVLSPKVVTPAMGALAAFALGGGPLGMIAGAAAGLALGAKK